MNTEPSTLLRMAAMKSHEQFANDDNLPVSPDNKKCLDTEVTVTQEAIVLDEHLQAEHGKKKRGAYSKETTLKKCKVPENEKESAAITRTPEEVPEETAQLATGEAIADCDADTQINVSPTEHNQVAAEIFSQAEIAAEKCCDEENDNSLLMTQA